MQRNNSDKKSTFSLISLIVSLCIVTLIPIVSVRAELASADEMELVCRNWVTYIISQTGDWAGAHNPDITLVRDIVENDLLLARYYELSSGGYVIVPVLKDLAPIKMYSEENTLDLDEPDGPALMLREILQDRMDRFVKAYGSLDAVPPTGSEPLFGSQNRRKWSQFALPTDQFEAVKSSQTAMEEAGPLLTTSWHQSPPYNKFCPPGDGEQCIVGCVATAAAQIIWYYEWPSYGTGDHSYYWGGDYSCGDSTPGQTLYADFSDEYLYDNSIDAKAEICYEMGVAYEMNYGACASGAWTLQGKWIYPDYFRYSNATEMYWRSDYWADDWYAMIQDEINMRRPILYQIPHHAIVCDGWRIADDIKQYHFNYGWGGSNNAWYTLDELYCPWEGCEPFLDAMVSHIIPLTGIPWIRADAFTDAVTGDGDGVFEAGETITLTHTIINFGAMPLTNVSVTISADDGSLVIVDGSTSYGTIPALDSVTNTTDPFTIEIPADYVPRIDRFYVVMTWNGGAEVDTVMFEQQIGRPTILLVDDDQTGEALEYYDECFYKNLTPYHVWEAEDSLPGSSDLAQYDIVFWYSGNYRPDPLDAGEIAVIKSYLDAGGNMLLTGQAIAAQLDGLDPDFLHNYLRATYQTTKPAYQMPILYGLDGIIADTSDAIAILSGSSANNQEYPDIIDSINGGIAEFYYIGQDHFGAVSYSGDYKLVFCAFGFESIVNDDYRWTERDTLFTRLMDFFGYQRPATLPEVVAVTVTPGDIMHLTDDTPDIIWSYYDNNANPQTEYHVQVGTDPDWMVAEMWDYGPMAGSDTVLSYGGAALDDGADYYIRVRVTNGTFWSDWQTCQIHTNGIPNLATDLSPNDMAGVSAVSPELSHTNAVDNEGDVLTYSYELYGDAGMTELLDHDENMPENPGGTTAWQISATLADNQVYYWRVRASDPYETGEWSPLAVFWDNCENQTPTPVDLVSPADENSIETTTPLFQWTASADTDPYDVVSYKLTLAADSTFSGATVISNIDTTEYTLSSPLEPADTYYWKVAACDLFGAEITSNQVFTFGFLIYGDANGDGQINVGDATYIISYIFRGGPPPDPLESGDANCDSSVDVGDAVYLISYIFKGGPPPGCD